MQAFACWHNQAHKQHKLRRTVSAIQGSVSSGLLRKAFNTWLEYRDHCRDKAHKHKLAKDFIRAMARKALKAAFNCWRAQATNAVQSKRKAAAAARFCRAILNRGVKAAFNRWVEFTQAQQHVRKTVRLL